MTDFDAIVVGARCAGSPTAMLLARQGHRVLLVDRMRFPSDTLSTHVIQPPGVAALDRWGLLGRVRATGCPPVQGMAFDFGPMELRGTPRPVAGISDGYAPRRTLLDKILVDAAAESGAEVREGFTVDELVYEDGAVVGIRGRGDRSGSVVERARVVIGADGANSPIARALLAPSYRTKPKLQYGYYTYFSDLPVEGFEIFIRPSRGFAAVATNDGLTLVVCGWPSAEAAAYKADHEANFMTTLELAPAFAERVHGASRVERFYGGSVPNFFRQPHGPGWVLVGDAGCTMDPITAQGMSDAFLDAESVAGALHAVFTGRETFDAAFGDHQQARDERVGPMYEFTTQLATLEAPPPEMQALFAALQGNQAATDDFVSVNAGTLSPAEFFDPGNLGQLLTAAAPA